MHLGDLLDKSGCRFVMIAGRPFYRTHGLIDILRLNLSDCGLRPLKNHVTTPRGGLQMRFIAQILRLFKGLDSGNGGESRRTGSARNLPRSRGKRIH
jgi:hypothetical protein